MNKNFIDINHFNKKQLDEIIALAKKIKQNPKKYISPNQLSSNKFRAISDFISGMTDRYAINLHNSTK